MDKDLDPTPPQPLAKIDQNSRQNFILSHRLPRESCRTRRDLQLSLGNLPLKMKFCLEIWPIFGSELPVATSSSNGKSDLHHTMVQVSSDPKIDQNSRQNFILSTRFPRESCSSHRDLQLSLGNHHLRMKFCLQIWTIFASDLTEDHHSSTCSCRSDLPVV